MEVSRAKLYVDGDTITDYELREPFALLAEAYSLWQGYPSDTSPTTQQRRTRNQAQRH